MKPAAFIFKADMKMKEVGSLKTLEPSDMLHGVSPEDHNLNLHYCENPRSYVFLL
jgi:hypothetical protein